MNTARKHHARSTAGTKHDERSSGVFLVAGGRVARRGSTRVEPSVPAEPTSRGRGRSRHGDA